MYIYIYMYIKIVLWERRKIDKNKTRALHYSATAFGLPSFLPPTSTQLCSAITSWQKILEGSALGL